MCAYTTTPPGVVDYNAAYAGTGTAPGHTTPTALTGAAPGHTTVTALTATAPDSSAAADLSSDAPGHTAVGARTATAPDSTVVDALSGTAPGHTTPGARSGTAPGHSTPGSLTSYPAGTGVTDSSPQPLPTMPSVFSPAFVDLTGGAPALAALTVASIDEGRILQGTVNSELKSYQVRAGTDAQALPGIVRPANFDASTNAYVFVAL